MVSIESQTAELREVLSKGLHEDVSSNLLRISSGIVEQGLRDGIPRQDIGVNIPDFQGDWKKLPTQHRILHFLSGINCKLPTTQAELQASLEIANKYIVSVENHAQSISRIAEVQGKFNDFTHKQEAFSLESFFLVHWGKSSKIASTLQHSPYDIRINLDMFEAESDSQKDETILHELVHRFRFLKLGQDSSKYVHIEDGLSTVVSQSINGLYHGDGEQEGNEEFTYPFETSVIRQLFKEYDTEVLLYMSQSQMEKVIKAPLSKLERDMSRTKLLFSLTGRIDAVLKSELSVRVAKAFKSRWNIDDVEW